MASPTNERGLCLFTNRGDLYQFFKNAQAMACGLTMRKALQRTCFLLRPD